MFHIAICGVRDDATMYPTSAEVTNQNVLQSLSELHDVSRWLRHLRGQCDTPKRLRINPRCKLSSQIVHSLTVYYSE
jgi:hypothetical protein